ncbi:MAG TPA: ABC transporter substrate-binding protein [Chloroflexota bacterium]
MGRLAIGAPAAALLAACGSSPLTGATTTAPVRIGYLSPGFPSPFLDIFRQTLRDLGYIEGQSVAFDFRFAAGQDERLSELAAELKNQRKADILMALGGTATEAAKQAAPNTPIVFIRVGDPVGTGLVESLATPGGFATGLTSFAPQLIGKRLEILNAAVPYARRVLTLWDAGHPTAEELDILNRAAGMLRLDVSHAEVPGTTDFEEAIAGTGGADALLIFLEDVTFNQRRRILSFANKSKLPTLYPIREFVDDGGLLSYGPVQEEQFKRAAVFVDKIVKGSQPWQLPIEQPIRFELVINSKAAKAIGADISVPLLMQADEVVR